MTAMNFMHITLHVTDLERSIAFYRRLGFEVMFERDRYEATSMPVFELGDRLEFGGGLQKAAILSLGEHPRATTLLVLVQFLDPPATPKPFKPKQEAGTHRIALRVRDLDGLLAQLREQGVEIRNEPVTEIEGRLRGGLAMRWTLFPDPDHNLIEVMEYQKIES